jgi:transcriptional regulator with XRE-family HTH domain
MREHTVNREATMTTKKKRSARRKPTEKVTSDIDKTIGHRLRAFRPAAKMSQTDLGNILGVTFQQIQKYENGKNRLSGSRLIQAAAALNVVPGDILGDNNRTGNNNGHDRFAALAEPAVNLMVRDDEIVGTPAEGNGARHDRSYRSIHAQMVTGR